MGRGARRAGHSPAAASRGPRRGAAAAGAWCRLARRLTSCAPSPASRASPLRGAGLRTPGTPSGASLLESERSAAPRRAGPVGGLGRGVGEGGRCFWGPARPSLEGAGRGAWGAARAPACCAGFQRRPGLPRPGVRVSAAGARGREAAAPAPWCGVPARGRSRDPGRAERAREPGEARGLLRPRPAEGRLGRAPCPLTSSCFAGEVAAGMGGGVASLSGRRKERAGRAPREFEGKATSGS